MSASEIWKDIKGYEGLYQVSNFGRIRSLDRWRNSGTGGYFQTGKILKTKEDVNGYLRVSLLKNGKYQKMNVHRLIAIAFIPNENNFPIINHKDGNKLNNNISNLEWCTYSYNSKHAYDNELREKVYGKDHWNYGRKVSEETREKLRKSAKENPSKGYKLSSETKSKMSKAKKGSKNPVARKVVCITTSKEFDTIVEASKYYKCSRGHISSCCNGNRKTCGKTEDGVPLEWKYL